MTKEQVEEIRNLNLELDDWKAKREALKKQVAEHRDSLTDAEILKNKTEAMEIKSNIAKLENKIKEKEKEAEERSAKSKGDNEFMENKLKKFNEEMTRDEARETAEYRSAFFKRMQGRELNDAETRAMTSGTGSVGAAIPTQTMDMILGQLTEKATLLGDVTVLNIPELLSIPRENVVNDASWVAEDADSENKDDTLTNISLSAYKLIRTIKITAKVSAMSIDAFEKWIVSVMTRKMLKAIENAIVNGTGNNQPTGLMNGIAWATEGDKQNAISIAAGSTVGYDDLVDAESLIEEDFLANTVYYMNRKMLAVVRKLKDENKKPLFERAIEDGFRGNLNGIPVKLSKHIPNNTIFVGDLKSGYVLNFAQAIEFATSKEAGFMSGSTIYRSMAHLDGKPTGVPNSIVKIFVAAE